MKLNILNINWIEVPLRQGDANSKGEITEMSSMEVERK